MPYRITYSPSVRRQIDGLPGHIKAIARQVIALLADDPRPSGSKQLDGHPNHYRLWLGRRYRLVWRIIDEEEFVEIKYVGPKPPDLYEQLGLGRPAV
jgi:mRNA interferase RelE/StbE